MKAEEWKPVVGYEGYYSVSDHGRIRRDKSAHGATVGLIVKGAIDKETGYMKVGLCRERKQSTVSVHTLVAKAFLGPRPSARHCVNHKDYDKLNCHATNLEWVTFSENALHAIENNLMNICCGENHRCAKLTEANVRRMREMREEGFTFQRIADEFQVSKHTAMDVCKRRKWKHVK